MRMVFSSSSIQTLRACIVPSTPRLAKQINSKSGAWKGALQQISWITLTTCSESYNSSTPT